MTTTETEPTPTTAATRRLPIPVTRWTDPETGGPMFTVLRFTVDEWAGLRVAALDAATHMGSRPPHQRVGDKAAALNTAITLVKAALSDYALRSPADTTVCRLTLTHESAICLAALLSFRAARNKPRGLSAAQCRVLARLREVIKDRSAWAPAPMRLEVSTITVDYRTEDGEWMDGDRRVIDEGGTEVIDLDPDDAEIYGSADLAVLHHIGRTDVTEASVDPLGQRVPAHVWLSGRYEDPVNGHETETTVRLYGCDEITRAVIFAAACRR